jgi:hypothetical protein
VKVGPADAGRSDIDDDAFAGWFWNINNRRSSFGTADSAHEIPFVWRELKLRWLLGGKFGE